MTDRPTHASVTDVECSCNYLQRAADDPAVPIVFDQATHEFQFQYSEPECDGPSILVIYHCPFCGGAAPRSRRGQLFKEIPKSEEERLAELLVPISSIDEVIETFGPPSADGYSSIRETLRDDPDNPPRIQQFRELCYTALSEDADVRITERPDGRIAWYLVGKYLGGSPNQRET